MDQQMHVAASRRDAQPPLVPVILSGGTGTRLWPLSRAAYPKQFIHFFNGKGSTFLAESLQRLRVEDGFEPPILLCNNDHRFLVQEEVERINSNPSSIVLEPIARNTAPAIAVGALLAGQIDPDAIMVVMPSDHVVRQQVAFVAAIRRAAEVAATGRLVMLGIEPTEPHTGYGYIKQGAALESFGGAAFSVEQFVEKPDAATAGRCLAEGGYLWNSGIFVLNARTYLDELARFEPQILEAVQSALQRSTLDLGFRRLDRNAFARSPDISVDYAVMERSAAVAVLPVDFEWNDIGSWSSLWQVAPSRDEQDNYVNGDALLEDTGGCFIHSEKTIVSTIGVKDLVIVNTPDALLVADKSRAQDVSKIVARLKISNRKEREQHLRNMRPWGFFETLNIGSRFQVKLLHVKPGGKLSLQMHHHRSEHWVVVHGTAKVVVGDVEKLVRENESVYIFATQWHRLENPGRVPLELIEVQIGTYLGEDDIIRSEDVYNRTVHDPV